MSPNYCPPSKGNLPIQEALKRSRKRYKKARLLLNLDTRGAGRIIRRYRLDNPYMAEHAWKTLMGMAVRSCRS